MLPTQLILSRLFIFVFTLLYFWTPSNFSKSRHLTPYTINFLPHFSIHLFCLNSLNGLTEHNNSSSAGFLSTVQLSNFKLDSQKQHVDIYMTYICDIYDIYIYIYQHAVIYIYINLYLFRILPVPRMPLAPYHSGKLKASVKTYPEISLF